MLQNYTLFNQPLSTIQQTKVLINALNAHSLNTSINDDIFKKALQFSNILLPDGISVVWAKRMLTGEKLQKIAGADLFFFEMNRMNAIHGKCFFLGSSEKILQLIKTRAAKDFPYVQVFTYSPPYKPEFSTEDSKVMIDKVNEVDPDVLFVGMTAPKQEKWTYQNFSQLQVGHVCCIGAVFDFYAGNINRAPNWMIRIGIEWTYRLIKEPRRMWRRYLIGNLKFLGFLLMEIEVVIEKQLSAIIDF
jgi:N-acetylglucosaminyldiphosphoundecaprenol N-acetyl-beta-D-mannosaminyltransferase